MVPNILTTIFKPVCFMAWDIPNRPYILDFVVNTSDLSINQLLKHFYTLLLFFTLHKLSDIFQYVLPCIVVVYYFSFSFH